MQQRSHDPAGTAKNGWYDDYSGWGNEVLYRMCRESPGHADINIVADKLWLIGRSYAAALERKAGEGYHIERTAWLLVDSGLDESLQDIRGIDRPDQGNLFQIVEAHACLTRLLGRPDKDGGTGHFRRSFASKYLHFHCPRAFFLYDSISSNNLGKALRNARLPSPRLPAPLREAGDPPYAHYALKALLYRDQVLEPALEKKATPRRIDMELQQYGWRYAEYMAAFADRSKAGIPKLGFPRGAPPPRTGIVVPRPPQRPPDG